MIGPDHKGIIKNEPVSIIFSHLKLFSLNMFDIFFTKLFMPREKDKQDIINMLENFPISMRLFHWHKNNLIDIFKEYIISNHNQPELLLTGINFYKYLQERYPGLLVKLDEQFFKDVSEYIQIPK